MSEPELACPSCNSKYIVKNGRIHNGKQNHCCNDCQRQFVLNPQKKTIAPETKALIDKLLLEKIPLAGIARVAEVSEPWLQQYMNAKYAEVPRQLTVRSKEKGRLTSYGGRYLEFIVNAQSATPISGMPMSGSSPLRRF
jgi:insertion element IS1 protein InsB